MAVDTQNTVQYFHLSHALKQLMTHLLGEQLDAASLQQIEQNPKILNALFDLSALLYEQHARELEQLPNFLQSALVEILKQGRIVQPYFANEAFVQPAENTDVTPQQDLRDDDALVITGLTFSLSDEQIAYEQILCEQNLSLLGLQPLPIDIDCPESFEALQNPESRAGQVPENRDQLLSEQPLKDTHQTSPHISHTTTTTQVIKMPYFQIPNARVGQPYQAHIQKQGNVSEKVSEVVVFEAGSVQVPPETGLVYDAENNQFTGVPTLAGDFQIVFKYRHHDGAWREGKCTLIITADPRSLWQVNEPATNLPYPKAHTEHQLLSTSQFKLAAASRRGRSHEHAGSFRDDDFFIATIDNTAWSVMIVADGAGSAPYSREGSRIAAQTTGQLLLDYIANHHQQLDEHLRQWQIGSQDEPTKQASQTLNNCFYELFYKAAQQSIQQIDQLAQAQEVSSKAFATTLLVAVVKQQTNKTFVSTFWVGDGAIAAYCPNKLRLMGTPDGGEFAGQTRFLDKAIGATFNERVNIGYFENLEAVILMTDGISDPKFETDAGLQNQQKWDALWQELQPSLQDENPDLNLLDWMHFFSAGHHDDRTLAILWPTLAPSMLLHTSAQAKEIAEASGSNTTAECNGNVSSTQGNPE
ncbi:MAG: protein phosphatase 2C domain-containing protein [Moraxellaceae bacterium]|nr:MAG: protein phosphatase 2C domain-containing protein [Moraxellaceae bacterium]